MKQNETDMCLHLHENTDNSHNMFEGYNGRRRLKTTLAALIGLLVLLALLHRRQSKISIVYKVSS
jgi:hypothetical protein